MSDRSALREAKARIRRGDRDRAWEVIEAALPDADDEQRPSLLVLRAEILVHRGALADARTALEEATAARDVSGWWNNLAMVRHRLGDFAAALDARDRGVALAEEKLGAEHPKVARALGDRAWTHVALGDLDAAEADLRDAAGRLDGSDQVVLRADALDQLGVFLHRSRGDAEAALACFDDRDALAHRATIEVMGKVLRQGFGRDRAARYRANRAAAEGDRDGPPPN